GVNVPNRLVVVGPVSSNDHRLILASPRAASAAPVRGCPPEVLRLDPAGADDFSVAWQSVPRTDPQSAENVLTCSTDSGRRQHEVSSQFEWHQQLEHPQRVGRATGQTY